MTPSLYNILTIIAAIWIIVLCISAMSEDAAAILALVMTLLSTGILLYRVGEIVAFLAGGIQ